MNKFDITNPEHKILPSSIENDQGYIRFVRLKKENFNKNMTEVQEIIQDAGYKFKQLTYNQMLEVKKLLNLEVINFSFDLLTGLYHTVHFFENDKRKFIGFEIQLFAQSVNLTEQQYIENLINKDFPKEAHKVKNNETLYETIARIYK